MKISIKGFFVFIFVLLLFGCATTKDAFNQAKAKDSIIAYESFLSKYPNSEFSIDAQRRLSELKKIKAERLKVEAERSAKSKAILSSYKVGHTTFAQYKKDEKKFSWKTGNYKISEMRIPETDKLLGSEASITVIYAPNKYCKLEFKGEARYESAVLISIEFND